MLEAYADSEEKVGIDGVRSVLLFSIATFVINPNR